ncbi:eukaryotic translation initiation factor 3C [Striga asiatica]|uniref:Eukaryotic translation initiation factor 3C n=1 Tax=Striga asiatica TaxID=4170 RepID=A0A5A7QEG3_STRAF|nr:eukaryotic translation initiation factor 3C [Striga asiatica]
MRKELPSPCTSSSRVAGTESRSNSPGKHLQAQSHMCLEANSKALASGSGGSTLDLHTEGPLLFLAKEDIPPSERDMKVADAVLPSGEWDWNKRSHSQLAGSD